MKFFRKGLDKRDTIDDPSAKACVLNKNDDVNFKLLKMIAGVKTLT